MIKIKVRVKKHGNKGEDKKKDEGKEKFIFPEP